MKILIISDDKAGHLNQSIAFAKLKGLEYDVIQIKENKTLKFISYIFDFFHIYINIYGLHVNCKYRAIVSTGSSTYYANKVLAKQLKIASLAIMLPKAFRLDEFDFILANEHDNPPKRQNMISIPINLSVNKPQGYLKKKSRKSLGIIIGGSNSIFNMDENSLKKELDSIFENYPKHLKYVTTSRRTPKNIDELLDNYKFDYEIIFSKDSTINPISDFIEVCSDIFITMDSTSMLSEARANSEADIHIIELDSKKKDTKFHKLAKKVGTMQGKFDYTPYLNEIKI